MTEEPRGADLDDLFGDAALRMLRSHDSVAVLARIEREGGAFPDVLWQAVADAGWFRVLLAEEHGGLGLVLPELGAVFRAAGRGLLRGPLLDLAVAAPLLLPGTAGAVRALLEDALSGKALVVMAQAEPPPFGRGLGAVRLEAGHIEGVVNLVPFAQHADAVVAVTTTGASACLALVRPDAMRVRPLTSLDPCVSYAEVAFDGPVPVEHILASGSEASALIRRINDIKRLMIAAELSGVVHELTTIAVDHAKIRHQFGKPIGSFQALQHMLAALYVRSDSLASLAFYGARDATSEPERLGEIAALAKAYATTVGRYAAEEVLQILGGIGFTKEMSMHLYYRRVLTYQGHLGESDALLRSVGASLLSSV